MSQVQEATVYSQVRSSVLAKLEKSNPDLAKSAYEDGWLDGMLLDFFAELGKRMGVLFTSLIEPVKTQITALGMETYRGGVARLQPTPPITFEKVLTIAADATADAMTEGIVITAMTAAIQAIPFTNLSSLTEIVKLYADLSPDVEIARVTTRRLVTALVGDPLEQFVNLKYRPKRMSRSDAEAAYKRRAITKKEYAEVLALLGIRDSDVAVIIKTTDLEIAEKAPKAPAATLSFEQLLEDIRVLDSYDAVFTRWLTDLKARMAEPGADMTILEKERLAAWGFREKLLADLTRLRKAFASTVQAQAADLLTRHAAEVKATGEVLQVAPSTVLPAVPTASIAIRGTGVPNLKQMGIIMEQAVVGKSIAPVGAKPEVPLDDATLEKMGVATARAAALQQPVYRYTLEEAAKIIYKEPAAVTALKQTIDMLRARIAENTRLRDAARAAGQTGVAAAYQSLIDQDTSYLNTYLAQAKAIGLVY